MGQEQGNTAPAVTESSQGASLKVSGVSAYYGEARALKEVSLQVARGGIVAVLGSNGAGKTTLLRTLSGIMAPRGGGILLGDQSIAGLPPAEVIRRGLASVPEGGALFGTMNVMDNLLLGAYSLSAGERKRRFPGMLAMAFETFPPLKTRLEQKAETLSGGERQMLAVARALMSAPRLMALDEPSLGLSPLLVNEMMRLLARIRDTMGISILLVEQNVKVALKIADYAYVLERGEVVLEGTSAELAQDPNIYAAYLGG
jgi:branched-chain amino acid transport system ATP-binding protein